MPHSQFVRLCSAVSKVADEKVKLRQHYRSMRDKMTPEYKHSLDIEIASRLLCTLEYMKSKTILTYVSKKGEVDTIGIIHAAFANKKQVAVPYCKAEGEMDFYLITSIDDLVQGKFGLMEPDTDKCRLLEDYRDSMCIVPAFTFDPQGHRLGYGGGYYDRFLSTYKGVSTGLCYGTFLKWDLPVESHDVPVELLVTDRYARHTADKI